MSANRDAIAMPFFSRQEFEKIKEFPGSSLKGDYEGWIAVAERIFNVVRKSGVPIEKVNVSADGLLAYGEARRAREFGYALQRAYAGALMTGEETIMADLPLNFVTCPRCTGIASLIRNGMSAEYECECGEIVRLAAIPQGGS